MQKLPTRLQMLLPPNQATLKCLHIHATYAGIDSFNCNGLKALML